MTNEHTTAREIQLMHEAGLARCAAQMDTVCRVIDVMVSNTLDYLDQHFKAEARERYYLRHRLVRLVRRVRQQRVWLDMCAARLGRALSTPERSWFDLGRPGGDQTAWAFRLHGVGVVSDWQEVRAPFVGRFFSQPAEKNLSWSKPQLAENYCPTPHDAPMGLNGGCPTPHVPHNTIRVGRGGAGGGAPFARTRISLQVANLFS